MTAKKSTKSYNAGAKLLFCSLRPWQTRTRCCGHTVAHDVSWAAQTGKHLLQTQNVSEQNQKHFLCPGHNICVRNKCCARGQTGKHLCPRLPGPLNLFINGVPVADAVVDFLNSLPFLLRPWQTRTHCCGHIVADTNVSLFASARNICCGHKICFWFCSERFCVHNKCFPVCAAQETSCAKMCPQQCVHVYQDLYVVRERNIVGQISCSQGIWGTCPLYDLLGFYNKPFSATTRWFENTVHGWENKKI